MRYIALIFLLIFSSCARKDDDQVVTQMRVRNMQTRTFVNHSAQAVLKEMLAVLQDQGYMVKNVSSDLGLVTAERDVVIEKFGSKFWAYVFSGKRARWKKHSIIEITTNVTEENANAKLRINFLVRIYDNLGRVVDVYQVFNEEVYTDFFNRVQKGLLRS